MTTTLSELQMHALNLASDPFFYKLVQEEFDDTDWGPHDKV